MHIAHVMIIIERKRFSDWKRVPGEHNTKQRKKKHKMSNGSFNIFIA